MKQLPAALLASFALMGAAAHAQPVAEPIRVAIIDSQGAESSAAVASKARDAAFRNMTVAASRINLAGGAKVRSSLPAQALSLIRYDGRQKKEEAVAAMRQAIDDGARFIVQGGSPEISKALFDEVTRYNAQEPFKRVLLLNYSMTMPPLPGEACSYWQFGFDPGVAARVGALVSSMSEDLSIKKVFLVGTNTRIGQAVLNEVKAQLKQQRPDITIVGDLLTPAGVTVDLLPYAARIQKTEAQAVFSANGPEQLADLLKATNKAGFTGKVYSALGAEPGAVSLIGAAGAAKVIVASDWLPNASNDDVRLLQSSFRQRFVNPAEDSVQPRAQLLIEALKQAIEDAGTTDAESVAAALEKVSLTKQGMQGSVRSNSHQLAVPLYVGVLDQKGKAGVTLDSEGSGYGFRVTKTTAINSLAAPQASGCEVRK